MTEIIKCEEYNQRGYTRYRKAVEKHNYPNEGGFPYLGFYIFEKPNGEPRNYGYVLVTEHCAQWFKTKREAYKEVSDE